MKPSALWLPLALGTVLSGLAAFGQPAPGIDEPYSVDVPEACAYLTAEVAKSLLRAEAVTPSDTNAHAPAASSQCTYTSDDGRETGFTFKFWLYEEFDLARLNPLQLDLNVTFAAGGVAPKTRLDDPGKAAFTFKKDGRTQLLVVTGIQGPPDGAGRPTELVALYVLEDASRDHVDRLAALLEQARRHLREWLAGGAVARRSFGDSDPDSRDGRT